MSLPQFFNLSKLSASIPEAEAALLGSVLLDNQALDDVGHLVRPQDFASSAHQTIYEVMVYLRKSGKPIDSVILHDELLKRNFLDRVGGPEYLAKVLEAVPSPANAVYYAQQVRTCADARVAEIDLLGGLDRIRQPGINGERREILRDLGQQLIHLTGEMPAAQFTAKPSDLVEILQVQHPPLPWLVRDVFVKGAVGWIGGPPKLGKSMLALHACLSIASGTPFLGRFPTTRGRALYISEEDPERIVCRRAQRMWAALDASPEKDRFRVLCKSGFRLDREECMTWLRRSLTEWPADLVVMDVFNRLHQKEGNDAGAMVPLLAGLDEVRGQTGCSILIVAHFRKAQAGQSRDSLGGQLAGSVALHGFSECSIYLDRSPDGKQRLAFEAKEFDPHRDLHLHIGPPATETEDEEEMDVNDETTPIVLRAVDPPDVRLKKAQNVMLARAALERAWNKAGGPSDGVSLKQILDEMNGIYTPRTLQRHLLAMSVQLDGRWGEHHESRYHPNPTAARQPSAEELSCGAQH